MNYDKPLVSIIVRTKDRPKLLPRALQSIAAQTYRPVEVVLVNDGGCDLDVDELKSIIGDVSLHYAKLEKNMGRAHAGNVGIKNVKGAYVGFLDDDDIYYENAIRTLCLAMDFGGWPVVYGKVLLRHYNEIGDPDLSKKDTLFDAPFDREVLLYRNYIPFNALLFDGSLFRDFGLLDESLVMCEDWDFLLKISDRHSLKYVPELIAEYSSFGASLGGGGRFNEKEIAEYEDKVRLKRLDSQSLSLVTRNIHFALRSSQMVIAKYESERIETEKERIKTQKERIEIEKEGMETQRLIEVLKGENEQLKDRTNRAENLNESLRIENVQLKDIQNASQAKTEELTSKINEYKSEVERMQGTISWRITSPLRTLSRLRKGRIDSSDPFFFRMFAHIKKGRSFIKIHGIKAFFQKIYFKFYLSRQSSPDNEGSSPFGLSLPTPQAYRGWLEKNATTVGELISQRHEALSWHDAPLISVIIPVFNTNPKWLDEAFESISNQSYTTWQAIVVDDCSSNSRSTCVIGEWTSKDKRFELIRRDVNGGVSAASRDGLLAAKGEFVIVLDHDDLLEPDALYHVARKIIEKPSVDVIYSDEILMNENENVFEIIFRPDFSLEYLLSHPYIVHLVAYRKNLAIAAGGYNVSYDVSQDYELLLKLAAMTTSFEHMPKPLYRWRIHPTSTGHQKQDKVMDLSKRAISEYLTKVENQDAYVTDGLSFNFFRVRRKVKPSVIDIVIPTKDRIDLLRSCVDSLLAKTVLPEGVSYNIIIADNRSKETSTARYFEDLRKRGVTIVDCGGPFNFSAINNKAAACGKGDFILFLNNDIEIIESTWLSSMLELAQRPDVGIVGAKLLYPDGTIQHAGVLLGINGVAAHSHQFFPEFLNGHIAGGHVDSLLCVRECMAVTAACMMVRRALFEEVEGFDENFVVGFGDTDLCLRIYTSKYRVLWTPHARLIHHESASRGKASLWSHLEDTTLMRVRWEEVIKRGDPFYNPNLSLNSNNFSPR